jgi:hypothetical protein
MKRFIVAGVVAITLAAASAWAQTVTIAQWTFETPAGVAAITNVPGNAPGANLPNGPVPADNGTNSAGSIANGLHLTAATYSAPAGDLDPLIAAMALGAVGPGLPGSGAATNNPSSHSYSANNWTAGDYFQFKVSTLGYTSVNIAWDQTGSNTGPRDFQLQYSLDGTTFATNSAYSLAFFSWNATTALGNSLANSFAGAVDNQANVYFRIVDNSLVSINGGVIGTAGTGRVDNFTVVGVPEPSTVALVAAGLLGMFAIRRRRS